MIDPDRIIVLDDSKREDRSNLVLVEALFELEMLAMEWRKRRAAKRVTTR